MATCPECDAEVEIDSDDLEELEVGDPWDCDACGSRLRVAGLDPLEFDSEDEEEDEEEEEEAKEGAEAEDESDLDEDFEEDDEAEDWDE